MKKIGIVSALIFVVIIVGIFLISRKEKGNDEKLKVGFVSIGHLNDNSWSESHCEGMETCKKESDIEVIYKEAVPCNADSVNVMEELIDQGCKVIFCNSYEYGPWELEVAAIHPDIFFFHATGTETADNLSTYFGRIYQVRYLCGIVAGLQTTTNEIGYVAAFNISEVNRGINAFTMGVRLVNPDATVHVEWCGSWTDDNMAAAATNRLIESHNIDVLTMHTDSLAPLEVAEKNKIWSIGYNTDNSSLFPDTYLTAPVWEWEYFYKQRIEECKYNQFTGKHYWEGMETGVVSLAPFTDNVKPEISAIVENEKKRIETGTYDVFYGPIRDNKGNLRIKDGESMTDDEMLNDFDWFVEGVKICE